MGSAKGHIQKPRLAIKFMSFYVTKISRKSIKHNTTCVSFSSYFVLCFKKKIVSLATVSANSLQH